MPKLVSEITSGSQYTKSQGDRQGQSQDSATRVFRVVLSTPGEVIDPQLACGVSIGSSHPNYSSLVCNSADIRFDGESRMAVLCTFQYQGVNSEVNEDQPPGTEQANWSLTSSLIEQPTHVWRKRNALYGWEAQSSPAVNSAGDVYDAITQLSAMINVSITQRQIGASPIFHLQKVGFVNSEEILLGPLRMRPHTVMFRGLQAQPFVADWRGAQYRGWQCTYEFAYKPNETRVRIGGVEQTVDLGWDVAVPQTGFNVLASNLLATQPDQFPDLDPFGQPLKHASGRVQVINNAYSLPDDVASGAKCRAMVRVFEYQDGGVSQAPSASPIPLSDDGVPLKHTANPKVLVYGYAVQPELNFTQTFGLRLQ